jgi:tRNA-splicing ligase RtcB
VGYDINCGVRLAVTRLDREDIRDELTRLVDYLYAQVPAGLGKGGDIKLNHQQLQRVLRDGAAWALQQGYGEDADLAFIEDGGTLAGADPAAVGKRALDRGAEQLGTLGSGNHFLEVGVVDEIFDPPAADAFGLRRAGDGDDPQRQPRPGAPGVRRQPGDDGAICSRQGADPARSSIGLRAREQRRGRQYLAAMAAAANYAFANRQILLARASGRCWPRRFRRASWACARCTTSPTTSPRSKRTWWPRAAKADRSPQRCDAGVRTG